MNNIITFIMLLWMALDIRKALRKKERYNFRKWYEQDGK